MRLFTSVTALLATVLLALGPGETRLQAGKPSTNIPVTVAFADGTTDNILSDGLGEYKDGVNGVVAYIAASNGILVFASNTSGAGGRQLQFNFGSCLVHCTAFPFLAGSAVAQVQSGPKNADGTTRANGLRGMVVGEELRTYVSVRVLGQPDEWTLCLNPPSGSGFCGINSTDGTRARIVRVRSDAWEIFGTTDLDAAGRSDAADLIKTAGVGKNKTNTNEGTYSMPFRFTVTCVNPTNCS